MASPAGASFSNNGISSSSISNTSGIREDRFSDNDYKQFDSRWRSVPLNSSSSSIGRIGCVLTTYGNMTGRTPLEVDRLLDDMYNDLGRYRGGYGGHRTDYMTNYGVGANDMLIKHFAEKLGKNLQFPNISNDNQLRQYLDNNARNQKCTEIRFGGHSVMLSGARYSNNNITHYLINDPGSSINLAIPRNTLRHPRWGKIKKIRWLTD